MSVRNRGHVPGGSAAGDVAERTLMPDGIAMTMRLLLLSSLKVGSSALDVISAVEPERMSQ